MAQATIARMASKTEARLRHPGVSRGQRLVLALAALLFLWNLGGHDLWAPDEPYFGEGAREMVVDGQWWVPHVNGVVTTDKPPLFFWLIALGSLPFGRVTPWTARLPSALAALGTVLLVMRLGRRFGGERGAWLAGLTVSTTVMFWDKARWSQIDSLLCFLIWVAVSAFEAWRAGDADGRRAGLLFWLAAALAVLAKGPVGFLLPLGIALVTLGFDRRLRDWRRFAPVAGPLLFLVVVVAWMVAATVGGGGEYSVWGALQEHFVGRAVHGMHHRQPPWYFLEVLPVQLLPWSGLVPGALVLAWRRRRPEDRFLLVASLFVVVFFSISPEKRELYALPAVPALALLVALLVEAVLGAQAAAGVEGHREAGARPLDRRWLFGGQVAVGALLTLVGVALPLAAHGREEAPYWMALTIAALLLSAGLATLWACLRSRALAAALAPAAGLAAGYLFAVTCVYPALEPVKSARPFAERMAEASARSRAAGHRVVALGMSNLPEAFAFYSDGVYTIETQDPARLAEHLSQPDEVWAVTSSTGFDALPAATREQAEVVNEWRSGRHDVLLVRNR